MLRLRHFLCIAALWFIVAGESCADWINLTGAETAPNIAEIYVLDDRVKLVLEVYVGDLERFSDLVPDDWARDGGEARPNLARRLEHFSEQGFQFVTGEGERLQAALVLAEARLRVDRKSPFAGMVNPITRQKVAEAPADKRVLYVELEYPFSQRPNTLTIVPPQDQEGRATATIGFIAYHKAVPIIDFRYLGQPAKLRLDWADPWYSSFENPNLKRHHKSAMMSFLYVEPYEVRHEVLTRVKDLGEWMDLGLRGDRYIELDELEPLKQRIGEFLLTKNRVTVDGKALRPILDRTNFVKVSLTGIQILEAPERLELSSAIVGVILTYITDGMPQQVEVDWELFTDQIRRVPATATDPAGPLATYLEPDANVHRWTNFLKNYRMPTVQQVDVKETIGELRVPLLSLGLLLGVLIMIIWAVLRSCRQQSLRLPLVLGTLLLAAGAAAYPVAQLSLARPAMIAGNLDDERAAALLQALLKNVYRAFDFRNEEDVYDKLALSVSGDLLTDIYLQHRRSMAVQRAGGAQAKIKEVAVEKASAEQIAGDGLSYALHGRWTALGTVGHWGHLHQRKNRYGAMITVTAEDGHWKIMGLDLRDEQRIDKAAPGGSAVQPAAAPDVNAGPGS